MRAGKIDVAEFSVVAHFFQVHGFAAETSLIADGQFPVISFGGIQHGLGVCGICRHWFFTHDVFSGIQCLNGERGVGDVGRANMDNLNPVILQKRFYGIINTGFGSKISCSPFGACPIRIIKTGDFYACMLQRREVFSPCNTAAADYTDINI